MKSLFAILVLLLPSVATAQIDTTNLKAYWSMDETSGALVDAINGYNAAETSGTIDAATGKIAGARDFEAVDTEYATIPDNANLSGGNVRFGFCGWFKAETTGSTPVLMQKGWQATGDVNREWVLYIVSGTGLRFTFANSGVAATDLTATSVTLAADTWYFFAVWYDPTADTFNLQVNNGTIHTASDPNGTYDGTRDFVFGASPGQTLYFDGLLDEILFFRGGFPNSTELTYLYNGGAGRSRSEWGPAPKIPPAYLNCLIQ